MPPVWVTHAFAVLATTGEWKSDCGIAVLVSVVQDVIALDTELDIWRSPCRQRLNASGGFKSLCCVFCYGTVVKRCIQFVARTELSLEVSGCVDYVDAGERIGEDFIVDQ